MANNENIIWSPWVIDENSNIDTNIIEFNIPLKQDISYNDKIMENIKDYRIKSGSIIETKYDFFVNNKRINSLRKRAWKVIEERQDCLFVINTRFIDNFYINLPSTWNKGWQNVMLQLHINPNENQLEIKRKLDILLKLPLRYRSIVIEPANRYIDLERYLTTGFIDRVICSGGSEQIRQIKLIENSINSKLSKKQESLSEKQWNELYNPNHELKLITDIEKTDKNNIKQERLESASVGYVDIGDNTKLFFPIPLIQNFIEEDDTSIKSEYFSDLNIIKQYREVCELYDIEFSFRSTGDKIIINENIYKIKSNKDKESLAEFFELNISDRLFNWKADFKQIENQKIINSASRVYEKLLGTYYIERKTEK